MLFLFNFVAEAQVNFQSKLNLHLSKLAANEQLQAQQINLLVQGDINKIRQIVEVHGGLFRNAVGNIATVKIPVSAILVLASSKEILRIESPVGNYTTMNDSMRSKIQVNEVHAGMPPLPQGYDGTGIAIGIIDTGVDFTHPDLQDSSGNTRVKYLWDQRQPVAANTPAAYGYGQEWNNTEIDAGTAAIHNDVQGFGHGTHVTGIASGDGSAINKNKGVAPGADIIEVAFDFNNVTDPTYSDAVDYIFNKAQLLGKPCVINASLGDYYGSHDGHDLQSQLISAMIDQQAGRTLVAAAGNAGNVPLHLGYNVTTDTSFTWVPHNPAYPNMYIQIWGDTSDFDGIDFSIGADVNTSSASYRGRLPFRDIFYNLGVLKEDTLFSTSGNRLAIVQSFGSIQGPAYQLEFLIVPDSTSYIWRLISTGSGRFDIWKFYDGTGLTGFLNSSLPPAAIVPEIIYYKLPDLNSTIVSGFQCLDNVITVGNYGNRNWYIDVNGNPFTNANTPEVIISNSSRGPTRDGRIKPDIAAPGSSTLSCGQLSLFAIWITQPTNAVKIAEGGFHFRDGGTSSASPVVAGVAALFLQQNPTATALQVKNAILQCAVQDTFTGNLLPDNTWGYGKVNAFNTLTNCSLTSIEEPEEVSLIVMFPNPVYAGETVSVQLKQDHPVSGELIITDLIGKEVERLVIPESGNIILNTGSFETGVYMLNWRQDDKIHKSGKLHIMNR